MARTELTKTIRPGGYSGTGTKLVSSAGDATNGNKFKTTGNELVIAENSDGASGHTVTIVSVDDQYNRKEDISSYTVPAGETHIFGPFPIHGWQQSDGMIYLDCGTTDINFKIVQL